MTKRLTTVLIILAILIWPMSILADQHIVSLPIVANGDINPLYASAPMKPFWRRGAITLLRGKVLGTAIITGLQTIVIRYYRNDLQQPLRWYLVAPSDDTWVGGELLRFGTFTWDKETALILVVPTTQQLMWCYADTLIAVNNGQVYGRAIFPLPCEEYNGYGISPSMLPVLRFWK